MQSSEISGFYQCYWDSKIKVGLGINMLKVLEFGRAREAILKPHDDKNTQMLCDDLATDLFQGWGYILQEGNLPIKK